MANNNIKIILLVLIVLVNINFILALGVSSPYWKDNPLEMYPGQVKDVAFTLTNNPDAEITTAFVSMDDNSGMAEITSGAEYSVTPGSTNTKVVLRISVPETVTIGNIYNIKFSVKSAPSGEQGPVQLIMGYNIDFPVKVVEQSKVSTADEQVKDTKSKEISWIIWGIIIVFVLIMVYFFFRKKR